MQTLSIWKTLKFVVWERVKQFHLQLFEKFSSGSTCFHYTKLINFQHIFGWFLERINHHVFTTQCRPYTTLNSKFRKTLYEKEKMLVTSIFSFSYNVFNPSPPKNVNFSVIFIFSSASSFKVDQSKNLLFGKELKPIPTFWRPWETSLLKTLWEKEKLLLTSNFSFFPQCFLPLWITFCHFR